MNNYGPLLIRRESGEPPEDGGFRTIASAGEIARVTHRLGAIIRHRFGGEPLNVIVVMDGAFMFAADLMRHLDRCWVGFVKVTSYDGTERGALKMDQLGGGLPPKRQTLIVDDIVDSGRTISAVCNFYRQHYLLGQVETLTLFQRAGCPVEVDYVGIEVPKGSFLIGYGLDYKGEYRNLGEVKVWEGR